jgi:hypothetical protein
MIWGRWLVPIEPRVLYTKFQRLEYEERAEERPHVQDMLTRMVHSYHTRSSSEINLLATLGYPLTSQVMIGDQRPKSAKTRRGHLAEILACEFARERLGYEIPVHRLRYNPNPDQSMKGDDILGFRFATIQREPHSVLVGEAKYRSQYSSEVVVEAYEALCKGFRPYPASVEFVATLLYMKGNRDKANLVRQVKNQLASMPRRVNRHYLLFLATKGRPSNPFKRIEEMEEVLDNLVVVNVSFRKCIGNWIKQVYEREISS